MKRYQAYVRVRDDGGYEVYPLLTFNGPYVLFSDIRRARTVRAKAPHNKLHGKICPCTKCPIICLCSIDYDSVLCKRAWLRMRQYFAM